MQNFNSLIEPRNLVDDRASGILEIRTTILVKGAAVPQRDERRNPSNLVQTSSILEPKRASNADPKAQSRGDPSRKDSPAKEFHGDQPTNTKEKALGAHCRSNLPSSLLNIKLGARQHPFPTPLNHALLRQKLRLTHNKQPEIRHAQANEFGEREVAGYALVKGPATIQKTAGQNGINRSSDIKADEQAMVRVRHKSAISMGGHAQPGGSITAMVRGNTVGALIDASTGGHGYMRDESNEKFYKDQDKRRLDVLPGTEIQQIYTGNSLTGSPATVKAEITGPGVLSIAAAHTRIGADKAA
ncbi:MAG: hypothetical protein GOMPHAMPRED_006658 [Gomphillus americanus]|uniref:Uncharacterized protein n=1 Tax=Gomphillus americanus TaxID=1940652 RepID=A0A8H3FV14_9LECA|nr:MAG: hypothetical protein GOMPHAMPRED_006658 [Gomphillus americanus]